MNVMYFKEWYVYNKINNQDSIKQGLDNLIPLNQISDSLKTFWLSHFNQLSSVEQKTLKLNYYTYLNSQT
jgi:hypothetical protein